jgi:hypothetical protein
VKRVQPESNAGSNYLIRHNLHVFNGFHPRGVALTGTVLQMQLHLGGRGREPVGYFSIVNSYQLIL